MNKMGHMKKNLPSILALAASAGVVVTAILAAEGHVRARDILAEHEFSEDTTPEERLQQAVDLTWQEYAPAVIAGGLTVACIIGSHKSHLRTEAALMGVIGVLTTRLQNMDKEVLKQYGKAELDKIRQNISQKEARDNKKKAEAVVKRKHGDLYYEPNTEQYFRATSEEIKAVEKELNKLFQQKGSVTLDQYIRMLPDKHLKTDPWTREVGWYAGDGEFSYTNTEIPYTGYYIFLEENPCDVKDDEGESFVAIVLQPSADPMAPSEEYVKSLFKNTPPYMKYKPEPEDLIEQHDLPALYSALMK